MLRKIVTIDQNKCDGCGLCVPSCAEGAITIVNGKAQLAAENLCDGLGACLGECPRDAITVEEREADEFDEAVYDLKIDEPEGADEPHAGDVHSARTAANELRRAGFVRASAAEDELVYGWSHDDYLEYKLAYDERFLMSHLSRSQRSQLERNARERLGRLNERDFRWHAPVVFARALKAVA